MKLNEEKLLTYLLVACTIFNMIVSFPIGSFRPYLSNAMYERLRVQYHYQELSWNLLFLVAAWACIQNHPRKEKMYVLFSLIIIELALSIIL